MSDQTFLSNPPPLASRDLLRLARAHALAAHGVLQGKAKITTTEAEVATGFAATAQALVQVALAEMTCEMSPAPPPTVVG